jgi:hypothetical protein
VRPIGAYESLFDGDEAEALHDVAPYVVTLSPSHWLFDELIAEVWGSAWGVFLTTRAPRAPAAAAVRRHRRRPADVPVLRPARVVRVRAGVHARRTRRAVRSHRAFIVESRSPTWAWELSKDGAGYTHARIGVAA